MHMATMFLVEMLMEMCLISFILMNSCKTLFAENKEKLINGAISSLLDGSNDVKTMPLEELEAQLQALRRLVASKAGFSAFTTLPQ